MASLTLTCISKWRQDSFSSRCTYISKPAPTHGFQSSLWVSARSFLSCHWQSWAGLWRTQSFEGTCMVLLLLSRAPANKMGVILLMRASVWKTCNSLMRSFSLAGLPRTCGAWMKNTCKKRLLTSENRSLSTTNALTTWPLSTSGLKVDKT